MINTFCTYSLCDYHTGDILEEGDYVEFIKFSDIDGEDCIIYDAIIDSISIDNVVISVEDDTEEFEIAVKDIIEWRY